MPNVSRSDATGLFCRFLPLSQEPSRGDLGQRAAPKELVLGSRRGGRGAARNRCVPLSTLWAFAKLRSLSRAQCVLNAEILTNTRTSVNEKDDQVPFPFKGKIDRLTFKLGPTVMTDHEKQSCGECSRQGERLEEEMMPGSARVRVREQSALSLALTSLTAAVT